MVTEIRAVSAISEGPTMADPDNFDIRAENTIAEIKAMTEELQNTIPDMNTVADEIEAIGEAAAGAVTSAVEQVALAAGQVVLATDQAILADTARKAAEDVANATEYNTGKAGGYLAGDCAYSVEGISYRCIQAQAEGAIQALTEAAYWKQLTGIVSVSEDPDPKLAGNLNLNDHNIEMIPTPGEDHSASGMIAIMTCGETLTPGNLCYIKSDGKMWKSDADAAATMPAVAIAIESGNASDTIDFLLYGFFRDDSFAWTPGKILYVSGVAGALTTTAPAGATDTVQAVAVVTHADRIFFNPSYVTAVIG